jgi:hypothetical protein
MDWKRLLNVSSAIFFIIVIANPAYGLRCGGRIVSIGDTTSQVIYKCGEPDHIESREEVRIKRDFYYSYDPHESYKGYREPFFVKEYVKIEEWTYNFGPTTFIRYRDKGYYHE